MLSAVHKAAVLEPTFAAGGYLVVDDALEPSAAEAVAARIDAARDAFRLVARNGVHPRMMVFDKPLAPAKEAVLRAQLGLACSSGLFTCIYWLWEVPNGDDAGGDDPAAELQRWFKSPACWSWVEGVTGVCPVECQVAGVGRYGAGDYLGSHTDRLVKFGHRRKVAFALYLSRGWSPGMGGELLLAEETGGIQRVAPAWNRLVLFDVDRIREHSSTAVTHDEFEKISLPGFFCV